MQIRATSTGTGVRLVMEGELDITGSDALGAAIDAVPATVRQVVLDLRAVTFVDSLGIGAVLDARSTLEPRSVQLVVVRGGPQVDRVFTLSGLDRLVAMVSHPSQADALLEAGRSRAQPNSGRRRRRASASMPPWMLERTSSYIRST